MCSHVETAFPGKRDVDFIIVKSDIKLLSKNGIALVFRWKLLRPFIGILIFECVTFLGGYQVLKNLLSG